MKRCLALILAAAPLLSHAAVPANPLASASFFPIAVWWQTANSTHTTQGASLAAAASKASINIFLGQGADWPETFGADYGEFEAIQQNNLYLIGGISVPWDEDASNLSVASILALAQSTGATNNLIGYNAGDEPLCGGGNSSPAPAQVPEVVAGIQSYDATRPVWFNENAWMIEDPSWLGTTCYQQLQSALQATSGAASFDLYPITKPWWGPGYGTDYNSVPNDTLWMQGVAVQGLAHYAAPGQRRWAYIESGGDNFGFSEQNGSFTGSVSAGSNILTSSGTPWFGSTWLGMTVSGPGIPAGTTISAIVSSTQAQMSMAATASESGASVTLSGGVNGSDCSASKNICLANGNEYRPTPAQVGAEVWNSIINGATGIEYFCHDALTYSFCLGDTAAAGTPALQTFNNLTYIDRALSEFAAILNGPTVALCSMDSENYSTGAITTASSCASGNFTLTSSNAVPGAALVKLNLTHYYIIAQSTRATPGGATYTFSMPALANRTARITYDSNGEYDHKNSTAGTVIPVNASGAFSDTIGAHDAYQTKIYQVK